VKIPWICAISDLDYALVTANNGSFLCQNNSSVGFLDEFNLLQYPAMLSLHSRDNSNGCFDWNPTKYMTNATKNFGMDI